MGVTGGLTRATILLFKSVVTSVCLVIDSVATLFSRAQSVTPSISIWHLLRSVQNVRCPACFKWCNFLVAPSFVTSPSILHGVLLWILGGPSMTTVHGFKVASHWAFNHGGPSSGEPSRAWWIFFRWYRVSQFTLKSWGAVCPG